MNPIGLTLPLKSGINGYFEQSYDTLTQIKANITNFLNTRPGERRFNPQLVQNYINICLIKILTDLMRF